MEVVEDQLQWWKMEVVEDQLQWWKSESEKMEEQTGEKVGG